jgi:hypothetical protein
MKFQPARLDTTATIVSVVVSTLLIGFSVFFLIKVPFGWTFAVLMIAIIAVSFLLRPKRYYFQRGNLIIEKMIGKKIIIRAEDIEGYALIPDFSKLRVARTFGNGGLFGYYGMFTTAEYGTINCQMTRLKNIIIIRSKKGVFAISPAEQERFKEHLKATTAGMTAELELLEPKVVERSEYANALILIIPITLFIITCIMVLSTYTQLPERIAVHFDFHGTPDRWGSKVSYLISGIVPASILLVIGIAAFFIVRRTTSNRSLPNFLVIIVAFVQLFSAYTALNTYWTNKYMKHLIPLSYSIIIFVILLIGLLSYYYLIVKKSA